MIILLTKVACSIKDDLLIFKALEQGIQEVQLDIERLYPDPHERREFELRLHQFLKSDCYNPKIISRKDGLLVYQTECIIPEKKNSKRPLLLLLGNPASHSVYLRMFFSFESSDIKGQRDRSIYIRWFQGCPYTLSKETRSQPYCTNCSSLLYSSSVIGYCPLSGGF